ncbi:MAG TPA: 4Fe-4S dicluster domain-containing protein [Thermoanaerobaculia bacterium]|nr:4Fe-4S dicluster domain-containing protein [Thermoanaerobaculia bacterium]
MLDASNPHRRATTPSPDASAQGPTRRALLEWTAAFTALGGVACRRPVEHLVPFVDPPADHLPGVPERYATALALGQNAYGVVVTSHDGRPTKIEGNELHPASLGATSAWQQAAILDLYDPDRTRELVRRPGPGESRLWEAATWDEWLEEWTRIAFTSGRSGGANLGVVVEGYASPTFADAARRFRERFPGAHWVVHEPIDDSLAVAGVRLATGVRGRPVARVREARCVLALDSDFLFAESDAVRLAREWSEARRLGTGPISRLYVAESTLTVTGANADHRVALHPTRLAPFALQVARELRSAGLALPGLEPAEEGATGLDGELVDRARWIAEDLLAAGGRALILVGREQTPALHALALQILHELGALGQTLTLVEPPDTEWDDPAAMARLGGAMERGEVDTVAVLGGNPAYTMPSGVDFARRFGQLERSFHLGSHLDETGRLARWHLPRAHTLEAWGDVRAFDGTPSVVQPLIRPLFDGRSSLEVLHAMATDTFLPGAQLVRGVWRESILAPATAGEAADRPAEHRWEAAWRRALHDGLGPTIQSQPQQASEAARSVRQPLAWGDLVAELGAAELAPDPPLTLELRPSALVHDGRFANNAWLQELPDPIAKTCWDNALWISETTAAELGVEDGARLRLRAGEAEVEAPVLIVPGQADRTLSLALGYGRTAAGRIGTGVGVDAYPLRSDRGARRDAVQPVRVERIAGRHPFAITQDHWRFAEQRHLVRPLTVTDLEGLGEATAAGHTAEHDTPLPLWKPDYDYQEGTQWGMAIDLHACIGCNACAIACVAENNVPVVGREMVQRGRHMHWLRIDRYFVDDGASGAAAFLPVLCQHCENAPCEEVCPVGATVHDAEGLNTMVYNRCIGTRYCSNNCPYKVRRFNFFNYTKDYPDLIQMAQNPEVTVRSRGVMEKCTYCVQRIHEARGKAKRSDRRLRDGDVRTACQQACPAAAISFGDIRDPLSEVAVKKTDPRDYTLLAELDTRPRTSYLSRARNPNLRWVETPKEER